MRRPFGEKSTVNKIFREIFFLMTPFIPESKFNDKYSEILREVFGHPL